MPEPQCAHPPSSGESDDLDRPLERFELAWQSGTVPAIEDFVPAVRKGRRRLLQELVKIDLEYRWRRTPSQIPPGDMWPARPLLEDYVARLERLGPLSRLPIELIGEEYRVRQRWGDRPDHAEYRRRFPPRADALLAELARIDDELNEEQATRCDRTDGPVHPPALSRSSRLRCPHCWQTIEIDGPVPRTLGCPACGGTFSVEGLSKVGPVAQPPARRLSRYELGHLLGTGAFGSVWQARDTDLSREVAVKLPRAGQFSCPADEERFLREARFTAQLHHPGIVAVYDVGREQQTVYIVSELVRGMNLAEWMRHGRLSFVESAEMLAAVADALDHAHRHGVIHRDVKPSNIMLRGTAPRPGSSHDRGSVARLSTHASRLTPLVMDFGLALRNAGEVTMTVDGQVLGTPAYMSPEQVDNPHAVDGRSDLYSLGVILYELLTGELPFHGMARMLLHQVVSDEPRPPRQLNDRVPHDLETICLKCLRKDPARRYRTAGALASDLRRWLKGEPIKARPAGWAERLWLWVKRNPALTLTVGLTTVALVAATGAPAAAACVVVAASSLLLALHKARAAGELAQAVEDARLNQQRTAGALQFALAHRARAREERDRAIAAEAQSRRRFALLRELARTVIFDLPDQIDGPARTLLVRSALAYLDGLAREADDDDRLLREVAVAYLRVAEVQAGPNQDVTEDVVVALAICGKARDLFTALTVRQPDNAQAQRDLADCRKKVAALERALCGIHREPTG
jgi:tRNA A-37 threonylcarbamoyl transferase component Bud32